MYHTPIIALGALGCIILGVVCALAGAVARELVLRNNPKYRAWLEAEENKILGPAKGTTPTPPAGS